MLRCSAVVYYRACRTVEAVAATTAAVVLRLNSSLYVGKAEALSTVLSGCN